MEAHIGEHRDEVEQHAEADRVGRNELRISQVLQHLPPRGGKPLRADEAFFPRQQQRERDGAHERQGGEREERAAPADEIAEQPGQETAAEPAEA
jgi:hypothetical protein